MTRIQSLLVLALALAGSLLLTACESPPSPTPDGVLRAPATAVAALGSTRTCTVPLRAVTMMDKTDSGNENRTPQIEETDIEPLVEFVSRCGGELALGIIDGQSNAPLARLFVPEPPAPPTVPEREGTPFQMAATLSAYRADSLRYARTLAARATETERRIEAFRAAAGELLSRPNHAQKTDIFGAISRSAYFLGEPGQWRREPKRVAIVVSDAIDNTGAPSVPLPPATELYLVNGTPSLGALVRLNPVRFEAFEAAVRHLLSPL